MRLAWILLAGLVAVCAGEEVSSSTSLETSTYSTTTPADGDKSTTTSGDDENTASTTEGPTAPTAAPMTNAPEPTDDGNTDHTKAPEKTTTTKAPVPTTTTVKGGSTTTKEAPPDVESFTVTCNKETPPMCTYAMQVPGLDIDTFNDLMKRTNQTSDEVDQYESTDLVELQAGVTKVFNEADATADYVAVQLAALSQEISALETQAVDLEDDINGVVIDISNANASLNKILNKKGSCLYRQCVLKETTTKRPTTTTTVRTTPMPFCEKHKDICQNDGACKPWYDDYYCECKGNLDGQDMDCNTSVCEVIKNSQPPGLVVSPGYNGTVSYAVEDCDDGAQWTVKAVNSTDNVLTLKETDADFKAAGSDYISKLSTTSNLQLTVGKYKLKITSKTKQAQIAQILEYGPSATISYTGPAEDYFHFTITEKPKPVTP